MKRSSKILFLLLLIFLSACSSKSNPEALIAYNNELMDIQDASAKSLISYYDSLEKDYDGTNLESIFQSALLSLQDLQTKAEQSKARKKDSSLKDCVVDYISGAQEILISHEKPLIDYLSNFTGEVKELYQQKDRLINANALALSQEIATLDKNIAGCQHDFAQKQSYTLEK